MGRWVPPLLILKGEFEMENNEQDLTVGNVPKKLIQFALPLSTPSGYRVLGIGEFQSVTSNLQVYNAWINGNYVNAYIRNMAVNTDYKDQMIAVQLYFIRNI